MVTSKKKYMLNNHLVYIQQGNEKNIYKLKKALYKLKQEPFYDQKIQGRNDSRI